MKIEIIEMRNYWPIISIIFLVSATILIWPQITDSLALDRCLDSGGSYDYINHICDFTQNHPKISFYQDWSIWLACLLGNLGLWVLFRKSNIFNRKAQIESLLFGDYYFWAVKSGRIKYGQALKMSDVYTVSREDVIKYLRTHPVPGFDVLQARYRDGSDGRKIRLVENFYHIGWQERGVFDEVYVTQSEDEAREYWINFLADSLGLVSKITK